MKIRTRLAIFVVAVMLSLAGFSAVALSVEKIVAASTPATDVTITVIG